jgi:hypothetical protein
MERLAVSFVCLFEKHGDNKRLCFLRRRVSCRQESVSVTFFKVSGFSSSTRSGIYRESGTGDLLFRLGLLAIHMMEIRLLEHFTLFRMISYNHESIKHGSIVKCHVQQ